MRWPALLLALPLPLATMRIEQDLAEDLSEEQGEEMAMDLELSELSELSTPTLKVRILGSCDHSRSCAGDVVKARRSTPTLLADEFVANYKDGIIGGTVNGWAAYKDVELLSISCEKNGKEGHLLWKSDKSVKQCEPENCVKDTKKYCRTSSNAQLSVKLPDYLRNGWSEGSPGWVMLFHKTTDDQYLLHGSDIISSEKEKSKQNCVAKRASVFGHEYGDSTSSNPHVGVFVEWDEGCNFGTIFELAWRNGLGGYGGKSNWYDDKYADKTQMMKVMEATAPGMIQPWDNTKSELRVFDVPFKTQEELQAHFDFYSADGAHSEPKPRFRAVNFPAVIRQETLSSEVKISFRSRKDIFQALLNYIGTEGSYDIYKRQCQTFAADLFYYLTYVRTTVYSKIIRPFYKPRRDWFLYECTGGSCIDEE